MELLVENGFIKESRLRSLLREGDEILSIIVSSAKATRIGKDFVNRKS